MKESSTKKIFNFKTCILLLPFIISMLFKLYVASSAIIDPAKSISPGNDAGQYHILAVNLVENGVFSRDTIPLYRPEIYRTPGYPLYVATFYHFFGENPRSVIFSQILLTSVVVLLLSFFIYRISSSTIWAFSSATLLALSPQVAYFCSQLMNEVLLSVVLFLIILILFRFPKKFLFEYPLIGILFGVMVLIRPFSLWFLLMVPIFLLIQKESLMSTIKKTILIFVFSILIILPWIIRNYRVFGKPTISTVTPVNIMTSGGALIFAEEEKLSIAEARDELEKRAKESLARQRGDTLNEVELAEVYQKIGFNYILKSPIRFLIHRLTGVGLGLLVPLPGSAWITYWGGDVPKDLNSAIPTFVSQLSRLKFKDAFIYIFQRRFSKMPTLAVIIFFLGMIYQIIVVVLAILGLRLAFRRLDHCLVIILIITILPFLVQAGESRFLIPVHAFIAFFAGVPFFKKPY